MLRITTLMERPASGPGGPAGKRVRRRKACPTLRYIVLLWLAVFLLAASEHHGQVKFGGLPVPGATVTATQGNKQFTAITDSQGLYSFADLPDGTWTLEIAMPGFSTIRQDVGVAPQMPSPEWDLKMLPLDQIRAVAAPPPPPAAQTSATPAGKPAAQTAAAPPRKRGKKGPPAPTNTAGAFQRADLNATNQNATNQNAANSNGTASETAPPGGDASSSSSELSQRAENGLLINGTSNNGASSPFALSQAFGNNRRGGRSLYTGTLGFTMDNSALDARQYSLTGQGYSKPSYNNFTGLAAFGGPLKIPGLIRNGPQFFVNYQWTRNRNVNTQPGLVPDPLERTGDFSGFSTPIIDPLNGSPFAGNVIPQNRISSQARALLSLYPLPNFPGGTSYNYQVPLVAISHRDALQTRVNKVIGRKNQVSGLFALLSERDDNPNLFGFLDTNRALGMNALMNWRHNITQRFFTNLGLQYSRQDLRLTPFFQNRQNVSAEAGITGNNQEPVNWGPPALNFFSGITALSDGLPSFTRNQTYGVSMDNFWNRSRHNVSFGGGARRQENNLLSQQDPRGQFTFNSSLTGSDFASFLLGMPAASSIAFGNADKYFRSYSYNAYVVDDWRTSPGFTVNLGIRWEYWSPITEKYGRLVNLDVTGPFAAVAPVVASNPTGTLTGTTYPDSLMQPDRHAFQPRVAFSWRPFPASSMVVRGGYGIYYNTSVYLPIVMQMAQQAPLSTNVLVGSTPSLAFNTSTGGTQNTFGVDPNFKIGYLQTWQLSVQRDLPASLVMIAMYQGSKGTHGMQEFVPNTYPQGAPNPCPGCPTDFYYVTSNGNYTRESGQLQLRRRLHNGLAAALQYTYAKAIDDDALLGGGGPVGPPAQGGPNQGGGNPGGGQGGGQGGGGGSASPGTGAGAGAPQAAIAQNWLNLAAERARSNFDQRHSLSLQMQYTTGMGLHGGTLVSGWRGVLFKQWTFQTQLTAATGLPLTPIYPVPVSGTGITGPVRPEYTGASLYAAPAGRALNPAALAPPPPGQWGDAGRNSINGPAQFSLNGSLGRTFQMSDRISLDLRVDGTNFLNHVTFPTWNTTYNNFQFGLPTVANAMRSLQTTVRMRF